MKLFLFSSALLVLSAALMVWSYWRWRSTFWSGSAATVYLTSNPLSDQEAKTFDAALAAEAAKWAGSKPAIRAASRISAAILLTTRDHGDIRTGMIAQIIEEEYAKP